MADTRELLIAGAVAVGAFLLYKNLKEGEAAGGGGGLGSAGGVGGGTAESPPVNIIIPGGAGDGGGGAAAPLAAVTPDPGMSQVRGFKYTPTAYTTGTHFETGTRPWDIAPDTGRSTAITTDQGTKTGLATNPTGGTPAQGGMIYWNPTGGGDVATWGNFAKGAEAVSNIYIGGWAAEKVSKTGAGRAAGAVVTSMAERFGLGGILGTFEKLGGAKLIGRGLGAGLSLFTMAGTASGGDVPGYQVIDVTKLPQDQQDLAYAQSQPGYSPGEWFRTHSATPAAGAIRSPGAAAGKQETWTFASTPTAAQAPVAAAGEYGRGWNWMVKGFRGGTQYYKERPSEKFVQAKDIFAMPRSASETAAGYTSGTLPAGVLGIRTAGGQQIGVGATPPSSPGSNVAISSGQLASQGGLLGAGQSY